MEKQNSSSQLKLPIIDFSEINMKPGTKLWDSTCNDVLKAFEEFGCFEALYDEETLKLQNALFVILEELFNLPNETKCRFTSNKPYRGYVGNLPDNPLYEAMGLDDAHKSEILQSFIHLLWPEGNSTFSEILDSYTKRLSKLEKMVKRMVFQSLGVDDYFNCLEKSTNYTLRFSKYKAPMTNEAKIGGRSHFDKNFLAILCENQVNGLEMQTQDWVWIRATPSPSSFIVMIGESFLGWSNGRLYCPLHRVMVSGNKTRYSFGLFSSIEGTIETPKELVDEQHPLLFRPFEEIGLLKVLHRIPSENSKAIDRRFADTIYLSLRAYSWV